MGCRKGGGLQDRSHPGVPFRAQGTLLGSPQGQHQLPPGLGCRKEPGMEPRVLVKISAFI